MLEINELWYSTSKRDKVLKILNESFGDISSIISKYIPPKLTLTYNSSLRRYDFSIPVRFVFFDWNLEVDTLKQDELHYGRIYKTDNICTKCGESCLHTYEKFNEFEDHLNKIVKKNSLFNASHSFRGINSIKVMSPLSHGMKNISGEIICSYYTLDPRHGRRFPKWILKIN